MRKTVFSKVASSHLVSSLFSEFGGEKQERNFFPVKLRATLYLRRKSFNSGAKMKSII